MSHDIKSYVLRAAIDNDQFITLILFIAYKLRQMGR